MTTENNRDTRIKRWLDRLLPVPEQSSGIERLRGRAFLGILLVAVVLLLLNIPLMIALGSLDIVDGIALLTVSLLYGFARIIPYRYMAQAGVVVGALLPLGILLFAPEYYSTPVAVYPILIAMLFASMFTSTGTLLQSMLMTGVLIAGMYALGAIPGAGEFVSWLIGAAIIGLMMLISKFLQMRIISDQQRKIDELTRSAGHYHHLHDLLPQAILIHSQQVIRYANQAAADLLNISNPEDLHGEPISKHFSMLSSSRFRIDHEEETFIVHYEDQLKTTGQRVEISATTITYNDQLGTLMVLQSQAQHFDTALTQAAEAAYDGIIITDADLEKGPHILYANPAFCQMTGYQQQELLGLTPRILQGAQTERETLDRLKEALLADADIFTAEATNYRKDGTPYTVSWKILPTRNRNGEVTGYLSIQRDVSDMRQIEGLLVKREEAYRFVSSMMSDYAYTLNVAPDGVIEFQWLTGAVEEITGYRTRQVMTFNGWETLVHPDDRSFYQLRQRALLEGETQSLEFRIVRPDGEIRWMRDTAHPLWDDRHERVNQIMGVAQDVTERVEAQATLKAHVVQQAVVAELGLLAMTSDEIAPLLAHVVVLVEQVLAVDYCAVFEHHAETHSFICRMFSQTDEIIEAGTSFSDDPHQSQQGYALQASEPIICNDLANETRYTPLPAILDAQLQASMSVMILGHNTPYGVISIYSHSELDFTSDEIYFLQSVANVIGTFIERNRAQLAERAEREFAEALRDATNVINSRLDLPEVLDQILTYVRQVVPGIVSASIMLRDTDQDIFRIISTWGFADEVDNAVRGEALTLEEMPLLEKMRVQRRPLRLAHVDDEPLWYQHTSAEKIVAYLGAPVIVQDECIGFLHLNSMEYAAFSERDADRLQTFADKVGTAIVNARYADQLEQLVQLRTDELKAERQRIEAILESTGEGVLYTEGTTIAYVNRSLCAMTGYTLAELIDTDNSILLPDDLVEREQQVLSLLSEAINEGETGRAEIRLRRKDGTSFEAGLTISPVSEMDQDQPRVVTLIRDISREKQLEELKSRFIATAAHELRSPITSMQTRMYMIQRQPDKLDYHLERLGDVVTRMNRLVGDLLDVATIEHGHIVLRQSSIILQEVCQNVVNMLDAEASLKGLNLLLHIPAEPVQIWADNHRLEQVFTNLLTNAMHYTPADGTIELRAEANANCEWVTVMVRDTGKGIQKEDLENIFRPFFRSQNNEVKGTGLGLAITREIVELHGGSIRVESEVGAGSTFFVTLPVLTDSEAVNNPIS